MMKLLERSEAPALAVTITTGDPIVRSTVVSRTGSFRFVPAPSEPDQDIALDCWALSTSAVDKFYED